MRTVSEKYLRELDLDVIVSYKDAEWLIVLKNFADYDRLEEQLSKMQQELNEQTAHSYCFYITTGRPYASIAKAIRIISDMREHAIPNKRLMIEEWAWELRKISYSEPSWEKWQEMFHKSTASGDSSYNTAYMDVMKEMLTYVDHACESGSWYLSDLKRFVKHMGDLLVKVLRDNNETFEELFDWQEYERMSFLARRSEQGCIDLIETVWKKMDSLHKTEDKAESTIAKLKKYIEENLGGELTRSVLAGQVYLSEDYITRLFIRETGQTLPAIYTGSGFLSGRLDRHCLYILQDGVWKRQQSFLGNLQIQLAKLRWRLDIAIFPILARHFVIMWAAHRMNIGQNIGNRFVSFYWLTKKC